MAKPNAKKASPKKAPAKKAASKKAPAKKAKPKRKGPAPGTGGRPRKQLDWKQIDAMCAIHCTEAEIAAIVGCGIETLSRHCKREHKCTFEDYLAEKSKHGKASLRRRQWKLAEAGDKTMLVWLGKNWLGQTDKLAVDQESRVTTQATVIYESNGRELK